jgi:TonB-dependent SusC/RagA subfamily outer membrane receptor
VKTLLALFIVSIPLVVQAQMVYEKASIPIDTSSNPLYIIDGIRKSKLDINPNDIKKMEVVKKEIAVALYGEQARNGVILVTTKKRLFKKSQLKP